MPYNKPDIEPSENWKNLDIVLHIKIESNKLKNLPRVKSLDYFNISY